MTQRAGRIIRQDRHRAVFGTLASFVFSVLALVVAVLAQFDVLAWLVVILPISCNVIGVLSLLSDEHLELDSDQFAIRTCLTRLTHRWDEIESFGLYQFGPVKAVGFKLTDASERTRPLRFISWLMTGFDETIPDVFETHASELLLLLCDWHANQE
jgi:hypothetical protein